MKNKFSKLICCSTLLLIGCSDNTVIEESEIIPQDTTLSEPILITDVEENQDFINVSDPIDPDYENVYTSKLFQNEDGTWGYEILDDSSTFIRQPNIPSISGTKGFSTENKANTTANFVIFKLQSGYFPPSLSKSELDSLGVLK